jgi:7,8-dihydroneopterin aldolase/epimerase/oxygenase
MRVLWRFLSVQDRILLRAIEFYGYHGVTEAERRTGRRYAVNLALDVDLARAGETDDVADTVDYGAVCERVLSIGQGAPVNLLETLAARIAAACLDAYPAVMGVEVAVRKLHPPVQAVVESAGVRIYRRRVAVGEEE